MAGKKKQVNKVAKRAASDGKITQREAAKVQAKAADLGVNNAAVAIARAAVNNQARIAQQVQQSLGLEQNKNNTKVNFTPSTYNPAPSPGVAPVTGFTTTQRYLPKGGLVRNETPIYTFQSKKGSSAKATKPAETTADPNADPNAAKEVLDQNPMNPMTDQWGDSVDNGLGDLQALIDAQIAANAEQTSLYMGMMQDMMTQMQMAQQPTAPQGAYAATTYQVAPAAGAQQTLAITPRKKPANTSLSIDAAPTQASGVGVNLAI